MDLNFITEMYVPIVLVACLILGYVLKNWIKDVDNKYIPTTVCLFGLVLNLFVTGFTIAAAVAGAVTGLASTGLHQVFKQFVEGNKE